MHGRQHLRIYTMLQQPGGDNAGGNAEANAGGTGDNVTDAEYEEVK